MTTTKSQSAAALAAYKAKSFKSTKGHQLPYRVLWPEAYDKNADQKYPILLFLHGAGERGKDNALQLTHGADLFLEEANRKKYPAIILFPQCDKKDYWAQVSYGDHGERYFNFDQQPNPSTGAVSELLDQFIKEEAVDPERIYIMGLSMGGMGTFEILARRPDTFAAAIPICGGTNPALLALYAPRVPLWIFHGDADNVVEVRHSREVVEQLKKLDINYKYTEYPDVAHNSWDNTFAVPELLAWLFAKRRQYK